MTGKKFIIFSVLLLLTGYAGAVPDLNGVLYQCDFSKGESGWKKTSGNCAWSDIGRVPGRGGSLRVRHEGKSDGNGEMMWTSPVIKLDKKAALVSFWAADNYLFLSDFSYGGSLRVSRCGADGKRDAVLCTAYADWDSSLNDAYYWGKRMTECLVWKYYELEIPAGSEYIMFEYGYRGGLVQGTCYMTDLMVTESRETKPMAAEQTTEGVHLELSTPAVGGLFYEKDILRFDALIYNGGKKVLEVPKDAKLKISISDFEGNVVASAEQGLDGAAPSSDKEFCKSPVAAQRGITADNHIVKRIISAGAPEKTPGILFHLKAELVSGGKTLAEDAIPYGVVQPLDPTGKKLSESYFFVRRMGENYYDGLSSAGKSLGDQDFTRKLRAVRRDGEGWYDWRTRQPVYPGPVNRTPYMQEFPLQFYGANIVQVPIARFIPEGAYTPKKVKTYYAGDKNKEEVDFNPDAYVNFVVENTGINRKAIDWITASGMERGLNEKVAYIQKNLYEKIHERYPEKKVGYSINFSPVAMFEKYELYKYADFLHLSMYGAHAGFPYQEIVNPYKEFYRKKLKRNPPPFVLTEGALQTEAGYIGFAGGTMRGVWSLIENGFVAIYYYNQMNTGALPKADVTDRFTADPHKSTYDSYRFTQRVDRPIMAPELVMASGNEKRRWLSGTGCGGVSILPTLSTMAYYNLVKDFDWKKIRSAKYYRGCKVYTFEDETNTVCGIEPLPGFQSERLLVESGSAFTYKDMFGRTTRIEPFEGKSVIQLSKYPSTLLFDGKLAKLAFKVLDPPGFEDISGYSGGEYEFTVNLPGMGGVTADLRVSGVHPLELSAVFNEKSTASVKGRIPESMPVGDYPARVFLKHGGKICGILNGSFKVCAPLRLAMNPRVNPVPGIEVEAENFSPDKISGTIVLENRFLVESMRPETTVRKFNIPPGKKAKVFFPVSKKLAKPNFNEIVEAVVTLDSGLKTVLKEKIHFRGIPHAEREIVVDGDLKDWPLDKLSPMPLERVRMTNQNECAPDNMESPGRLYALWRDNTLYLAVVVKDNTPISRSQNVNLWMDDNLLFAIYPWRRRLNEGFHPGYYREHIGLHKDGTVGKYRFEGVPSGGSPAMDKVQAAIRYADGQYVYEIAYPAETLYPVQIKPGGGFCLSLANRDTTLARKGDQDLWSSAFFAGGTVNYSTNPARWYEFIFEE